MPPSRKYREPPVEAQGFAIFVRNAYPKRYNFAVENYNAVATTKKRTMRGGRLLLFRAVAAGSWIAAMVFAVLVFIWDEMYVGTVLISTVYIALSVYNIYVSFDNRDLIIHSRFLKAKVAGASGLPCEWVTVPLDSRSSNERLAAVDEKDLDRVRKEFAGSGQTNIDCLVYTKRYADTYPNFPKEAIVHLLAFLLALIIGFILIVL